MNYQGAVMKCVCVVMVVVAFGSFVVDGSSSPRVIDNSDEKSNANYGAEITLYCTSVGSPLPAITWRKSQEGIFQILHPNDTVIIKSINHTSTKVKSILTISSVVGKHGTPNIFSCEAANTNGTSDPVYFEVQINGKPKAPVIYSPEKTNSSSILVKWKAVKKVARPILVYTLYYSSNSDKRERSITINITGKNVTDNYEYRLTKLSQLTTYIISISATNKYGEGNPSEVTIEETLAIDPQPPEISLNGPTAITNQNISLKFVPSPFNERVIYGYQLFVEVIITNNRVTSAPISLPKIYGNHSLNKSKHNIYVAAHFVGNLLPGSFILGDDQWYGYHINKKLKPLTKYRIYIRALAYFDKNKMDKMVFGKPKLLVATTAFPQVPEVVVIEASGNWMKVAWNAVKYDKFFYKLVVKQDKKIIFDKRVDKLPLKLKDLEAGKTYMAHLYVCAGTKCRTSSKGMELKTVDPAQSTELSMQLLIIIIVVGSVAVLVIITVAVICCLRRRKRHKQGYLEKQKSNIYSVTPSSRNGSTRQLNEDQVSLIETKPNGTAVNEMELKPIRAKPLNGKDESSTDPRNEWEFAKENIKIIKEIERDGFGKICTGSVRLQKDADNGSVMLRILKDDPSESLKAEFSSLIEVMKRLPVHNGVTNLLGCITKQDPTTIIMEYVPYGDLLGYMRTSRGLHDEHYKSEKSRVNDLGSAELMSFAEQIASAMAHLERYNVMHGDLAARNVLVGRQGLCKLTRFGETNALVFDKDTYATRKKDRLLVKWAAIEVVMDKVRTIQSDVWSFGILLYEIATVGGCPYVGKDENWLLDMLKDDYRMPCPDHVSEALYSVMLDCWTNAPGERPNFEKLVKVMRTLTLMNKHQDHINMTKYDGELFSKLDDV